MARKLSWVEEAWEFFLSKHWDSLGDTAHSLDYTKQDLDPILGQYTKSGQGEIRIFHSGSTKREALKKRGLIKVPVTRSAWRIVKRPPPIEFIEPVDGGSFLSKYPLTDGMLAGIKETMGTSTNPGETTLLAIANHIGLIADFYGLQDRGVLFTGGRQRAGVHLVLDTTTLDMTKAQIEIDGGFEWPTVVVIAEMKSSFKQPDFDVNQALIPTLKWQKLLSKKKVYSLVLLAQTNIRGLEYRAYDLNYDPASVGMNIARSKKYIIELA